MTKQQAIEEKDRLAHKNVGSQGNSKVALNKRKPTPAAIQCTTQKRVYDSAPPSNFQSKPLAPHVGDKRPPPGIGHFENLNQQQQTSKKSN